MLQSLSSKIVEFSVAEQKRENALEPLQNTLQQEQNRLNQSFEPILENFRLSSNRTIEELTARQQKDYEALMEKRTIVAFSAYTTKTQAITSNTNVKYEKVLTNIGNGYDPTTGILTAPRQGVYHISAVVMSINNAKLHLTLKHNNKHTVGSFQTGGGIKIGTFDVVLNLQKGGKISVGSKTSSTVRSNDDKYTHFLDILSHNHIITHFPKQHVFFCYSAGHFFKPLASQFE